MKKLVLVLVILVLAIVTNAQEKKTAMVSFINTSRSERILVSIPELFEGEYGVIKDGPTAVKITYTDLTKDYPVTIKFEECGGYTEKTTIKVAKTMTFGDLRGPCKDDGQKGPIVKKECQCEADSTYAIVTNLSNSEFKCKDAGPFHGLTLGAGQSSPKCKIALGIMNLTLLTFKDTTDRKVEIQSVITRFVTKDPNCIFVINVKQEDLSTGENLIQKQKITAQNATDRNISFVDDLFKGISLAPNKTAKRKDRKEISVGFIPATIEFLDDNGVRLRVNIYKHIVPGDAFLVINQKDLGLPDKAKNNKQSTTSGNKRGR